MEDLREEQNITCNFAPPEVATDSLCSRYNGESLADIMESSDSIVRLRQIYQTQPDGFSVYDDSLASLEQQALYDTAKAIRSCVRYERGVKPWQEQSTGDCYTFTWVLSDLAESLGFESRIVFSNSHAFNIILTRTGKVHVINADSGDELWFFDTEHNPVSGELMSPRAIDEAKSARSHSPSYHPLYTSSLRSCPSYNKGTTDSYDLPWLEDLNPAAAIMTPEQGKRALFTYACWQHALSSGDLREVTTSLDGLRDCNPQAETRGHINTDLKRFMTHVKRWSTDYSIKTKDIYAAIQKYQQIMPQTKSMLVHAGDYLRYLASARRDLELLAEAESRYELAAGLSSNTNDETLAGKIRKAKESRLRIQAEHQYVS